jgi:hypothetical protein
MQDPTYRGQSPYDIKLSSIINNGMQLPQMNGASGAMVAKMVGDYLKP